MMTHSATQKKKEKGKSLALKCRMKGETRRMQPKNADMIKYRQPLADIDDVSL